ncbi:MAG: SpoIID/LytB domain-containing protein, partial [Candidatus Sericytochromatia bacterium]|nr:SpoIID/LytB domain-containing protein [Candidatus Sericytochromatia bacterium]
IGVATPATVGGFTLAPGHSYQFKLTDAGALSIQDTTGRNLATVPMPARIEPADGGATLLAGRRYRGALEIIAAPGAPGKLTVVNDVGLEDYLKGVLPAEMVTGWPTHALQAQAVAARTYAAANMGRRAALGFDLYPTVSDQVYKGQDSECVDTSAAVDSTRGEAMTYQGSLINALFFSSSGGATDDAKAVWDIDLPYIKSVKDPDGSPNAAWKTNLSKDQVTAGLTKLGVDVGTPTKITITAHTPGGRARWLSVTGTKGTETVDAAKFRLAIGLKSTMFQINRTRDGWQLDGSGYGHGLGMSQWGAHNRAAAGQAYQDILKTYYTGIEIGGGTPPANAQ